MNFNNVVVYLLVVVLLEVVLLEVEHSFYYITITITIII